MRDPERSTSVDLLSTMVRTTFSKPRLNVLLRFFKDQEVATWACFNSSRGKAKREELECGNLKDFSKGEELRDLSLLTISRFVASFHQGMDFIDTYFAQSDDYDATAAYDAPTAAMIIANPNDPALLSSLFVSIGIIINRTENTKELLFGTQNSSGIYDDNVAMVSNLITLAAMRKAHLDTLDASRAPLGESSANKNRIFRQNKHLAAAGSVLDSTKDDPQSRRRSSNVSLVRDQGNVSAVEQMQRRGAALGPAGGMAYNRHDKGDELALGTIISSASASSAFSSSLAQTGDRMASTRISDVLQESKNNADGSEHDRKRRRLLHGGDGGPLCFDYDQVYTKLTTRSNFHDEKNVSTVLDTLAEWGIPDQNFASLLGDVDSHQLIRDMAEKYLRMVFKNQVFRLLEGKD